MTGKPHFEEIRRALPRQQQHLGDMPTREIHDSEGRSWVLGEVPSVGLDGTVRIALVAEDGDLMRRFANFPPDWHELTDDALIRLVRGSSNQTFHVSHEDRARPNDHPSEPQPGQVTRVADQEGSLPSGNDPS